MRWTARVSQKRVLDLLLRSHEKDDPEEKFMELAGANRAGEQRLWWYKVLKSYCSDCSDGAIIAYDEPVPPEGLHGFDEERWELFKKADLKFLGREGINYVRVQELVRRSEA